MPIRRRKTHRKLIKPRNYAGGRGGYTRQSSGKGQISITGKGWGVIEIPTAARGISSGRVTPKGITAKPRKSRLTKPMKLRPIKPVKRVIPPVQTYKRKLPKPKKQSIPVQKSTRWTTGAAARPRRGLVEQGRLARIQVQNYKTQKIIKIQKGRNLASGRPWRGPPGSLGDDVIVEILPTVDLAMDAAGIRTGTNVDWKVLWNSINQFYLDIVMYMKEYIGRPFPRQEGVVPTDTGILRRKMWQSIERQWYSKTKMPMTPGQLKKAAENGDPLLMVVLNTGGLMYAKPVNQMPTKMVAHPHKGSRNYGRGGSLWDPTAQGGWYDKVLMNGRNRAKTVNHLLQPVLGNRPKLMEVFYK